jgi:hypothetical protein
MLNLTTTKKKKKEMIEGRKTKYKQKQKHLKKKKKEIENCKNILLEREKFKKRSTRTRKLEENHLNDQR